MHIHDGDILGPRVLRGVDPDDGQRDDQKQKKENHGRSLQSIGVNADITLPDNLHQVNCRIVDLVPDAYVLRVRRLAGKDWAAFREIRLRALTESPAAFSSTLAEAISLDEAAWRARLGGRAQFIAIVGADPIGTAGGIATGSGAELISMWVDPRFRRAGVGDRLVRAVLGWARRQGYSSVHLWVAAGNEAAERLYRRHGFVRTGEIQPMGAGSGGRCELAMTCRLDPAATPGRGQAREDAGS
jgi:GNAT superfamily N-acetyltransferase